MCDGVLLEQPRQCGGDRLRPHRAHDGRARRAAALGPLRGHRDLRRRRAPRRVRQERGRAPLLRRGRAARGVGLGRLPCDARGGSVDRRGDALHPRPSARGGGVLLPCRGQARLPPEAVRADDPGGQGHRQPRDGQGAGRRVAALAPPVPPGGPAGAQWAHRQGRPRRGGTRLRQARRLAQAGEGAHHLRLRRLAWTDGRLRAVQLDALPQPGPPPHRRPSGLDPARALRLGHDH